MLVAIYQRAENKQTYFDAFATDSDTAYDVTDAHCSVQNGSTQGRVFKIVQELCES